MNKECIDEPINTAPPNKSRMSRIKMQKTKEIIKKLPEKKAHFEFISAVLTIPVLITVLLLNLNNLLPKNIKTSPSPTPSPMPSPTSELLNHPTFSNNNSNQSSITSVVVTTSPIPTSNQNQCTPGIGSINIGYPQEGETVSDNPLCISINYSSNGYCSVVWAYSINGSNYSNFSNNNVCLYSLPSGQNTISLQVKSLVSPDTTTISRHFIFISSQPTINNSPTPNASSSASL